MLNLCDKQRLYESLSCYNRLFKVKTNTWYKMFTKNRFIFSALLDV